MPYLEIVTWKTEFLFQLRWWQWLTFCKMNYWLRSYKHVKLGTSGYRRKSLSIGDHSRMQPQGKVVIRPSCHYDSLMISSPVKMPFSEVNYQQSSGGFCGWFIWKLFLGILRKESNFFLSNLCVTTDSSHLIFYWRYNVLGYVWIPELAKKKKITFQGMLAKKSKSSHFVQIWLV